MKDIIFFEKIAVGGMSTVYKGRYNDIDVVIKKLHTHLSEDKAFIKRFRREAEVLKRLKHPNIIRFISFEKIENDYFLILEFIDGENLGDIIRKRKIPLSICLNIGRQVAKGINYAHRNGIIHRDIKPSNVIISKNGTAKILDFGLAYEEGTRFTDPGVYIGTPAYIAPEVLSGGKYSPKSDVFSYGVFLYEIISGNNPFEAKTPFETINRILYTEPEKLNIDEDLNDFIFRCISKSPENRIKDFGEIIKKINEFKSSNKKELILWLDQKIELKDSEKIKKESNYSFVYMLIILVILVITSFFIDKFMKKKDFVINKKEEFEKKIEREVISESVPVIEEKKLNKDVKILKEVKIQEDSGYVSFDIKGDGEVFINNNFFKTTPITENLKMKTGDYFIRLVSGEGFFIDKKITIKSDDTTKIQEVLKFSYLKLNVKPWGYVFVDGENKGMTPITPIRLTPGVHRLTITNPKYNEWSKEIYLKGGETLFINVELK